MVNEKGQTLKYLIRLGLKMAGWVMLLFTEIGNTREEIGFVRKRFNFFK